ncbi:MAG TPA: hypothetical protein VIF15_08465 [Polyangiaceae bacterium]|jgi:hypothetical protein
MSDPRDRIDDPDAPPTDEEIAAADKLRAALDDPGRRSEEAELARALSAAWSPRDLAADDHRRLMETALTVREGARRRGRIIRVSFGASAVLALAAGVLLVVWNGKSPPDGGRATASAGLAVSRSTQALFPERFAPMGGETARIDRIAMARGADLRDNEFAKWGVR